jgi:hypothetical protein
MCSPVMNRRSSKGPSRSRGMSSQRTWLAEDAFMVVTSGGSNRDAFSIAVAAAVAPFAIAAVAARRRPPIVFARHG